MNAPAHACRRRSAPPAPIAASAAACWREPDGRGGAVIAGDPDHPANFGRLCSKGSALGETLGLEARLLHPMLRQTDGTLARVDWDDALDQRRATASRGSSTRTVPTRSPSISPASC